MRDDKDQVPMMLQFLFGEAAPLAQQTGSERLMRWAEAFDRWMGKQRRNAHASTYRGSMNAWKRLLGQTGKPPWEISQGDMKDYVEWMEEEGLAPATINYQLSKISSFYRWCSQEQIDAESGAGFNPTEGVARPKVRHYANAKVLSQEEVRAFLAVLKLDEAVLSKRDYAFFLARLRLGVALKALQQLQWRQIETDEQGAWVKWSADKERTRLLEDVHQAIVDYLVASGRLEGIRGEAYIFAPQVDPLNREATGTREDWDEGRFLGSEQIKVILKRYGQLVGIPEEKLTLPALRHTAAMLRLEAGDSMADMQIFLDGPSLEVTKNYLRSLPSPATEEGLVDVEKEPPELPERKSHRWKSWERMTHGMRVIRQPPEEVAAVLAENIRGIGDEIEGLRVLGRELLEMQERASDPSEVALLAEAYTLAATRLGEMIKAQERLENKSEGGGQNEGILEWYVRMQRSHGREIDMETAKSEVLANLGELESEVRRATEEVAGVRLMLRRLFCLAMETEDVRERVKLAGIYGNGCNRLVRLLKGEGSDQDAVKAAFRGTFDRALLETQKELNLK
jgi:site-specific recombinase XerD